MEEANDSDEQDPMTARITAPVLRRCSHGSPEIAAALNDAARQLPRPDRRRPRDGVSPGGTYHPAGSSRLDPPPRRASIDTPRRAGHPSWARIEGRARVYMHAPDTAGRTAGVLGGVAHRCAIVHPASSASTCSASTARPTSCRRQRTLVRRRRGRGLDHTGVVSLSTLTTAAARVATPVPTR